MKLFQYKTNGKLTFGSEARLDYLKPSVAPSRARDLTKKMVKTRNGKVAVT